jgi:hypothetical protein
MLFANGATNSTEQSPSWEASSSSSGQKKKNLILKNPTVRYRIHNAPIVPILI